MTERTSIVLVLLRHDRLDLFLRSQFVETLPRLHRQAGQIGPLRRIDFRHVIESLRRKPRALLRAQLQSDLFPGENWRQLWRQLLAALPPDEAAKVMVDALHVAAKQGDLADVERYMRRQLRRGELNLTALRDHYGLRPPRGLAAMPQLDIPEHTLSSYDE
ncbi:MAG: IS21 family transposase, partial [Cyanobacteria bacterium J06638_7]